MISNLVQRHTLWYCRSYWDFFNRKNIVYVHNCSVFVLFPEVFIFAAVRDRNGFEESFTFVKPRLICELGLLEKSASYLHNPIILPLGFQEPRLGGNAHS